jgi:hypothetical protein
MITWASVFEDQGVGSFPAENVRYIDSTSGLTLTGQELVMCQDWGIFHAWQDEYGERVHQSLEQAISSSLGTGYMQLWQMHQVK